MRTLPENGRLIVASHNPGKVREIAELLAPLGLDVVSAGELGLPEPEETGATFVENAVLKARAAAQAGGAIALADDSGVCVNSLGGQPGIYSARWAGPQKDFTMAMQRIHEELGASKDRSAAFICVLALAWPDGHVETFEGRLEGNITWPPRGNKGFGYDPVFIPEDHGVTFGEMEPEDKHRISHRARAFQKMIDAGLQSQKKKRA